MTGRTASGGSEAAWAGARPRRAVCCAAAAAMALAALAGCGGEGSGEEGFTVRADTTMTTAEEGLTKAEFVARINRTCRRWWPTILDNFTQFAESPPPEHRDGHRYAKTVQLSFMAGLDFYVFDAIYDLGAPPGDEERLEELLGTMQESVERTQRGLSPIRSPAQLQAHFAAYNRLARSYGLDECLVAGAHLPPALTQAAT